MSSPDDLQQLWQGREDEDVSMQLIEEKRTSFDELVRAENMAEYVVAMIMGPLLTLVAWRARHPLVRFGFGMMAATLAVLALYIRIAHRRRGDGHDRSLREHLKRLLALYDQRLQFFKAGGILVTGCLSAGLVAALLGGPGATHNLIGWAFVVVLIPGFWYGQWLTFKKRKAALLKKREQAEAILRDLHR